MLIKMQDDIIERLKSGEKRAVSRLITLVENKKHDKYISQIKELSEDASGKSHVIGITGSGGVGKSSLIDNLIKEIREGQKSVGVLAVDPSSPVSGGAILGDRIRMGAHTLDDKVFIRSFASRGHGALSAAIRDSIHVLKAAQYDYILVETVGAGQSDVEIASIVDTLMLVLSPDSGDSIQFMKAGLMEVADIYVVNKSDLPNADLTVNGLEQVLNLSEDAFPKICQTSYTTNQGFEELYSLIKEHYKNKTSGEQTFSELEDTILKNIDHIGIAVKNLEDSIKIYTKLFGEPREIEYVKSENVRIAVFDNNDYTIELLEPTEKNSSLKRFLEKRGEGMHHIAYVVDDIHSAAERIKTKLGPESLIYDSPKVGSRNRKINFIHPKYCSGVLIEICEESQDS